VKNLVRAGVVIMAILALAACSKISSGWITEKQYTEGYYTTTQVCVSYDPDDFHCTLYVPQTTYHPPTWRFDLVANDEHGDPQEGWVYVTEETYDQYAVGGYYQDPEER
jgi:hypothetical protein